MERGRDCLRAIVRCGLAWRSAFDRSRKRVRGSAVCLGFVGAFIAEGQCLAQGAPFHPDPQYRLTVRPREMATGTRTERAGEFRLGANKEHVVYVPRSCVGTRRCPLILFYHRPELVLPWLAPVADKYGMIVLSPEREAAFDVTLKEVLRTFAIDPDRIAIVGRCGTGMVPIDYGDNNPDVFNRLATFTSDNGDPPVRAPMQTTEYFLSDGIVDGGTGHNLAGARMLRDRGYPVKHVSNFRAHTHQAEDYDFLGHWLQESWAIPDPANRPVPYHFGSPPVLTTEALAQMTAFWTRFMQEPDSVKATARQTLVREVIVPVGTEQTSLLMVDMAALAAKYPSVAAALKAAGLTAERHDSYRAALASARLIMYSDSTKYSDPINHKRWIPLDPTSMVVKNFEFMSAHPDEAAALETSGMWTNP